MDFAEPREPHTAQPDTPQPRIERRKTQRARREQKSLRSGTLTAGSIDDNERFDDYAAYLAQALRSEDLRWLPEAAIQRRLIVTVTNSAGLPIGDARVQVRQADAVSAAPLIELTTASDGRVLLLPELDGSADPGLLRLSVTPPAGGPPVTQDVSLDDSACRIILPEAPVALPQHLDVALVLDTTGSMEDELEYLKAEIAGVFGDVRRLFPHVDPRFSLIVYRDQGDEYVIRTFDFTSSLDSFQACLEAQSSVGGGDYPEAVHTALEASTQLSWRRRQTARVLFLLGDAPPHDHFAGRCLQSVSRLRRAGVRVFPVAASGAASKAEFVFRRAAFETLGQYLFLTDHSGVGAAHAAPSVPHFSVEHLDRLMVRMIASELCGRKLAPQEIIATETPGFRPSREPVEPNQASHAPPSPVPSTGGVATASFVWPSRWLIIALALAGMGAVDFVSQKRRRSLRRTCDWR